MEGPDGLLTCVGFEVLEYLCYNNNNNNNIICLAELNKCIELSMNNGGYMLSYHFGDHETRRG